MPILDKPLVVAWALAYVTLMLGIGLWSARRTKTTRDFFIAGQRVGLLVVAMATMSSAFSGFLFIGGPGLTYRLGVASLWIVIPVSFTGGLLCWVVGKRLRLLSGIREVYTIPDAIACRFGSPGATGLAAVAIVLGSVAYLGAQIQALGVLLQAVFGLENLLPAMLLGVALLLAYSVAGGMVAGVYTDVVQGGLMLFAAVAVFIQAVGEGGGWRALTRSIAGAQEFGARFLDPLGTVPAFTAFGFFFVFGVGVLGQPQILHKFYMLDDPRKLRWMPLVLGSSQAVCLLVWIGIGLAVPALVARGELAALARPDDAAPLFLLHYAGDMLAGLVLAGALAAIMSTADSFVNIAAAALVRDLPRAWGRPVRAELTWSRVAVALVALAAALGAYVYDDLVAMLGTFAFGTLAAALAPALAVGLNWERVTGAAAAASIGTGLLVNLGLELLARQATFAFPLAPGALPSAAALASSFTVLFVVSWATSTSDSPMDDGVRAVMRM